MRFLAATIVLSLLAACGRETTSVAIPAATKAALAQPTFDPKAPVPAMSGATLEALGADVPELAQRREAILTAEREAIKATLAAFRKPPAKAGKRSEAQHPIAVAAAGLLDLVVASAHAAEIGTQVMLDFILGHNVTAVIASGIANGETKGANTSEAKSVPFKGDDGKVIASISIGAENGQPVGTLETKVDLPIFYLQANSKVVIAGSICPDANGQVDFTLKLSANGHAGKAGSTTYDQDIEARIVATVGDDDANVANAAINVKQATRSALGGRQAYVESSLTAQLPGGSFAGGTMGTEKVIRTSSKATAAETTGGSEALKRGTYLAYGALEGARENWQGGNCIKIRAESPGRVSPNAISRIPVAVKHLKDGSSVPAKVTVALAGGKSAEPAVIPHAPGDVTHVAPNDRKARMTITLVATSRRGKDTAKLELSIGGQAFRAEGGLDDFHGTGTICDIAAPFTIEGGGNVVKFVPASEKGGTYSYAGNMSGFAVFGNGTYSVQYQGDVPVGITGTGKGSVKTPMGVHSNTGTEKYTLTPSSAACPTS